MDVAEYDPPVGWWLGPAWGVKLTPFTPALYDLLLRTVNVGHW